MDDPHYISPPFLILFSPISFHILVSSVHFLFSFLLINFLSPNSFHHFAPSLPSISHLSFASLSLSLFILITVPRQYLFPGFFFSLSLYPKPSLELTLVLMKVISPYKEKVSYIVPHHLEMYICDGS